MIESIEFANFKALRKTTLPIGPFTLLLGPNGSGKTSVLQALDAVATSAGQQVGLSRSAAYPQPAWRSLLSVTAEDSAAPVIVTLKLRLKTRLVVARFKWISNSNQPSDEFNFDGGEALQQPELTIARQWLARMQTYSFDANSIAQPNAVNASPLQFNGTGLVAVLDDLKDNNPERWESLIAELKIWLPEYDHIQFDKPNPGHKGIVLRTKKGGYRIPARELSQGTLISLALLTVAYMPNAPTLIGIEEIDRGLHPRLLRHLQDALYRLSYPESCGEKRPPIQVVATTHSPYLLDLYKDHPEEVVLAEKKGLEVEMKRLADVDHYDEIMGESPLSEVWYSGVLGGASVKP